MNGKGKERLKKKKKKHKTKSTYTFHKYYNPRISNMNVWANFCVDLTIL